MSEDYDRGPPRIQPGAKSRLSAEGSAKSKALLNGDWEPAEGDALDLSPVTFDWRLFSDNLIRDLGGDPEAQGLT